MIKLSICGISDLVYPYCKYGYTGRVHSIFHHSFNIIVGQHLIHVSGEREFLSSFGIQLESQDFQKLQGLQIDDLVTLKKDKIIIYSQTDTYILSGPENVVQNMMVFRVEFSQDEIEEVLGLVETQLSFNKIGIEASSDFHQIQEMMQSGHLSLTAIETIIQFLIGRGLGLTPSGDDLLLGYFWGMRVLSDYLIQKEVEIYLSQNLTKTTIISREYLDAFLKGFVSSPIYRLNKSLERRDSYSANKAIQRIATIGHTSGYDFLFGLFLSLKCIQKMKMRGTLYETEKS